MGTADLERGKGYVNRIAYTSFDGNIFTIKPDCTDPLRLTTTDRQDDPFHQLLAHTQEPRLRYAWPIWSPDGKKLATSRINADSSYSLDVLDTSTGKTTTIYNNEFQTAPVSRGAPHVMSWSPNSKHLTFLASTQRDLTLFISTPEEQIEPSLLVEGGPIYFGWSEDSSALLVHCGAEMFLAYPAIGQSQTIQPLGTVGTAFKAPSLSHDASQMVYGSTGDAGNGLYLASTQSHLTEARLLFGTRLPVAFQWSPAKGEILVADAINETRPVFQRLTKVSLNDTPPKTLINEPYPAFFWSPNKERIIYLTFNVERSSLTWKYVKEPEGGPVELVEFWPSDLLLTMVSDFDQFAFSNPVWSPDSRSILFCGTLAPRSGHRNGGSPGQDKIYVLDVDEGATPREIADGPFAVWSWN